MTCLPHLLVLLLGLLVTHCLAQPVTWHHRSRWQLAVEQDGNVKESPHQGESATSLRLLTDFEARRLGSKGLGQISFQSAYQAYWHHRDENKLMGDLRLVFLWPARSRFSLGAEGALRGKLLIREQPDYLCSSLVFFAEAMLPGQVGLRASGAHESLDYAGSTLYDQAGWHGELQVSHALSARLALVAAGGMERTHINRPALRYDATSRMWVPLDCRHQDRGVQCGASLEVRTFGQWRISYRYEKNNSNSYGYSFSRHRVQVLGGCRLSHAVLLRLFGALQRKRYAELFGPWIPVGLDTEREQSNLLVIDLSHDLAPGYTALLRMAWYDNESLVRARYYQKRVLSVSVERRL